MRDRPYAEVASEFEFNPGTLRTRVHDALHQLRNTLDAAEIVC